jgi:uncharacterized RDD family membrane protein YckC
MRADPFSPSLSGIAAIDPARLEGVLPRRVFAFLIDATIILAVWLLCGLFATVLAVLTFGLLSGGFLLLPVIGPLYHTLTIGLSGATWGQRALGLEVCDLLRRPPSLLQAIVQTAVFYISVPATLGLVLLAVFFLDRKRTLHDWLSGLQVLRRVQGGELLAAERRT